MKTTYADKTRLYRYLLMLLFISTVLCVFIPGDRVGAEPKEVRYGVTIYTDLISPPYVGFLTLKQIEKIIVGQKHEQVIIHPKAVK